MPRSKSCSCHERQLDQQTARLVSCPCKSVSNLDYNLIGMCKFLVSCHLPVVDNTNYTIVVN